MNSLASFWPFLSVIFNFNILTLDGFPVTLGGITALGMIVGALMWLYEHMTGSVQDE